MVTEGFDMKYSHNKNIVPLAKELRENMTPKKSTYGTIA